MGNKFSILMPFINSNHIIRETELNIINRTHWHKVNHGENNGMEEGICCSYDHEEVLCYVVLEIFSHAGYNSW